jgi:hypothetical protein
MTPMTAEIAAKIQLANLKYQREKIIIELQLKFNRANLTALPVLLVLFV